MTRPRIRELQLQHRHPHASISRQRGAAVTGEFANTFSWDTFNTVDVPVTLASGSNTIKFSNSSTYAPDVDYIQLAKAVAAARRLCRRVLICMPVPPSV